MAIPHGRKGREWLRIANDRKYGLGYVDSRFELPYDFPPVPELVKMAAMETYNKTVDHMERLSHWKLYDKIEPIIFVSGSPTKNELDVFNRMTEKLIVPAVTSGLQEAKENIVLCIRIWFIRELDEVNLDALMEEVKYQNESVGFVSTENMPEGAIPTPEELRGLLNDQSV